MNYTEITGTSRLPSGYQEVEYLYKSASDTEQIYTGIESGANIRTVWDVKSTKVSSEAFFGSYGGVQVAYTSNYGIGPTRGAITGLDITKRNTIEVSMGSDNLSIILGANGKQTTASWGETYATPIYIFGLGSTQYYSKEQWFYGLKIYNSSTLLADFVPCYRTSDNKPGVYDIVGSEFHTSSYTNGYEYTVGPVVNRIIQITPQWNTVHQCLFYPSEIVISSPGTPSNSGAISVIKFTLNSSVPTLSIPSSWELSGNPIELVANSTYELILSYDSSTSSYTYCYGRYDVPVYAYTLLQQFTSSSSYQVSETGAIYALVLGGGGGGSKEVGTANKAGSGGNGGQFRTFVFDVTAGDSLTITVGSGGASNTNGTASSITHSGTTYTAEGGYKGGCRVATAQDYSASGGYGGFKSRGAAGCPGWFNPYDPSDTYLYGASGAGGSDAYYGTYEVALGGTDGGGSGGYGTNNSSENAGSDATGYGAGGGGAAFSSNHTYNVGGSGHSGIVKLYKRN